MKTKFLSRIGMWNTPPCIRKCLTSLKSLTLLLVMLMSVNVWGEEVTMSYSGSTTSNMTGGNDAPTVGLDASSWSVVGDKGGNNNFPGLNKAGQIRLYGSSTNHNTITVTNLDEDNISSIKVTYGTSNYNAKVTVDDAEVTGTGSDAEKTYAINSTSFTIAHNYSTNTQVYILSIVITTGGDEPDPTEPSLSVSPKTIDFGTVYQKADVAAQQVTVTFSNLTANDVEANTNDLTTFDIDKYGPFTSGDKITITPNTYGLGEYEETLILFSETDGLEEMVTITMEVIPAPVLETYNKVTAISDLAEGDIIVLASSTTAYGIDPGENHAYIDAMKFTDSQSASLTGNVLKAADAYELTLAKSGDNWTMTGANGLVGTSAVRALKFGDNTATNTWSISIDGSANASIESTTSDYGKIYYNSGSPRFLNYTSSQAAIQIYKKQLAPTNEAVTFAAPENGSLVIKNGATPISSGATIQNGTVLDVTFGMSPAEAYKDVAIKVTNTSTSEDVTSTVYDATTQKITMPRYAITVAVTFTKLYKISLVTAGDGTGSATMNGVTTDIYVDDETQIDLVANAVAPNVFTSWSATDNIDINEVNKAETYALASGDGTITATFGISALLPLGTPILSAPTNITYSGVTLNWEALAHADAYNVEILLDNEVVTYDASIGETSWTPDATLQANTTYTYTVQGVGDGSTYAEENNPKAQSTFTTADYPAATLTLSENGTTRDIVGKLNTPIELPTTSTQACDGKVFMGWSENAIDGEVAKEQVTLLGATYTFDNPSILAKTIYAVYAAVVSEGQDSYQKATSLAAGDKVIWASEDNSKPNEGVTGYNGTKDATVSTTASDWMIFTVEAGSAQGTFKFKNGTNYIAAASSSFKVTTTASDFTLNESSQAIWTSGSDKYALMKNGEYYRCYKTSNTSYTKFYVWKIVSGEKTYSNYCTTCQAAVAAPTFGLEGGNYSEAKTLTLSATEGDIYYTINDGEETKYTAAIALNNRGTYEISAYAKVDARTSETVTKTYTLDWAYTLAELVDEGAPTTAGRTVTVILTNEIIESFATSGSYVNGFFTMVGDKKIEVYCQNSPAEWEVGGKVSGTVTCPWKDYKGTWELCPTNWDWASYTAPAKITSLEITGDVTNKNYTAGQKLDFTGLTVTGVYSDANEEDVTADVVWTEVTLTENQPEATATATLNNAKTGNVAVNASKSITGLTVGAAKTLESIYVADESAHKTTFFVGRPFSSDGLKVMAKYNIGDDQPIAVANLTITNTSFTTAEAEHAINISYTENGVEKTTSYNVEVTYMNLNDLVAEDIATNTSVKVAFSDVEITGFYTNKSNQRTGVYVNVKGKNNEYIELYSSGTPSETLNGWQEGGKLASKGDYITGTWKYYDGGSVWEIDFGSNYAWSTNIEYTAPVIYPTAVALSETTATLKQSKTLDLTANFTPDNATVLNNLEWSSDNTQVTVVPSEDKKSAKVTVASDATAGNTATITVKVDDKDGNELSATCVITIEEYSVPRYGLYAGDITEGDYIFKADGKNYFMNNTINSSRLTNVASEDNPNIINNVITTDAEAYVWHIAKSDDYWTIQNLANNKYAAGTGTRNQAQLLDAGTDDMAKWTITYDEAKDVYTFENLGRSKATSYSDNKYLRNNDNSGWACYANGTGNAITLYKAGFTPAPALSSLEITGELSQTEYFQGKSVKYDGLSVLGHYSDGSEAAITDGITWSADPASFTELGEQTVTITATVQTKTGEVSDDAELNVTVVESHQINYGLVTSVNTLYDGAVVVLGAVYEKDDEPIYAVNQGFYTSNYKYLLAYRSNTENSDLEYEDEVMKTANASEITLKKVEDGWLLIDENNNYICGAADLSKTTKVEDATIWTISIADGKAVIAAGDYQFFYNKNSSSERFKTYASSTSTQEPVGIYMKNLVAVRTGLTAGKIATYCETRGASIYDGAAFFEMLSKDAEVKNVTLQEALSLSAGMPYIIEPTHNILKVVFEGEAVSVAGNNNGLYGWLGGQFDFSYQINDKDAYFVSGGKIVRCGNSCTMYPNRAYIVVEEIAQEGVISPIPGRRCIRLATEGSAVATGCEDALYISNDSELKKVVVDGQFFIIRNGKVFDAQGKLVK